MYVLMIKQKDWNSIIDKYPTWNVIFFSNGKFILMWGCKKFHKFANSSINDIFCTKNTNTFEATI